jgi:hypothetical protein
LPQDAEVLRIIAEAALFLVSVTIPTYAISASFLGKETVRTMSRIKMQRENTERRIHSAAKNIEEMQAGIRAYELEEEALKGRLQRVSVWGVVVYPAIWYGLALVIALVGIYNYPNQIAIQTPTGQSSELPILAISFGSLVVGSYFLGKALFAIDKVARETEFASPSGTVEIKVEGAVNEGRRPSTYYFVDTAVNIEKLVVDWQRKVAYWFDTRVDKAVREGKISAFAVPTLNQTDWTSKENLTLVKRPPSPDELPL